MDKKILRCAVYTRKSTEEGLDKEFNSLEAQREAGEAYIKSQMHEGWQLLPQHYDDGGYSGGSMERPALKQLLADIRTGKIDVVVVYKVDRISRSLHDFAQIVATFEERNVSFVSVTQQFNTTTSMGRLTLNILLSFAQFEREVIGERVRDKFAASKQKGMWMGGFPPLGYDIEQRKLIVNEQEAKLVRHLFQTYLDVKSGLELARLMNAQGHHNKRWINRNGTERGGDPFANQSLYKILRNPTYIGKVRHKNKVYDGQHASILDEGLWQQVQAILEEQKVNRKARYFKQGALLGGKCFAQDGGIYTPTHSTKDRCQRYYYYIHKPSSHRINAAELERLVFDAIHYTALQSEHWKQCWDKLPTPPAESYAQWKSLWAGWDQIRPTSQREMLQNIIERVTLTEEIIKIRLSIAGIAAVIKQGSARLLPSGAEGTEPRADYFPQVSVYADTIDITLNVSFQRNARSVIAVDSEGKAVRAFQKASYNDTLIHALAKSWRWNSQLKEGKATITNLAKQQRVSRTYISRMLNLSFLAPDIVEAILNGSQSETLKLKDLMQPIPVGWEGQKFVLRSVLK